MTKLKLWQKLKMWQKSKTQIMVQLKNLNCDKNQKLKLWQNSKSQIVTQIKLWQNSKPLIKKKTDIVTKLKNLIVIKLKNALTKKKCALSEVSPYKISPNWPIRQAKTTLNRSWFIHIFFLALSSPCNNIYFLDWALIGKFNICSKQISPFFETLNKLCEP